MRTLDVPVMEDEKALLAAVRLQAPDQIPMPIDEAILDMQPLGTVQTVRRPALPASSSSRCAARWSSASSAPSARPASSSRDSTSPRSAWCARSSRRSRPSAPCSTSTPPGLVNVAVANAPGCLFTRAAAGGIDAMAATLSERRGLTFEHARQWMTHVGLVTPLDEVDGDAELVAAARSALDEGVHQIADTVRNSLNFYRMQESAEAVDRVILTGPAVEVPGLAERLSRAAAHAGRRRDACRARTTSSTPAV